MCVITTQLLRFEGMISSFTCHQDPKIDSVISKHMRVIVDKLLKHYPKIESVILSGGFGRGEGSVWLLQNGGILPLGDYDIYVITDSKVSSARLNEIRKELWDDIGITTTWRNFFDIEIEVIPTRSLRQLSPDISTYELKVASKLLYGKDYRNMIPFSKGDVAVSSGFITLSIRAMMLLKVLDKLRRGVMLPEEKTWCVYQCSKVFTEICTAISLLQGFYEPSYAKRAVLFAEHCGNTKELKSKVPSLPSKVKEYTYIKLYSAFDKKTLLEALTEASFYWRVSFMYFVSRYLGVKMTRDDWRQNARKMYGSLRLIFLRSYLMPLLNGRKVFLKPLVGPLALIGQLLENVFFVNKIHETEKILHLKPLISPLSPLVKIFISAILAFLSVEMPKMKVNPHLLREAYVYLSKAYPCHVPHNGFNRREWETWKNIIDACCQSMTLYSSSRKRSL